MYMSKDQGEEFIKKSPILIENPNVVTFDYLRELHMTETEIMLSISFDVTIDLMKNSFSNKLKAFYRFEVINFS